MGGETLVGWLERGENRKERGGKGRKKRGEKDEKKKKNGERKRVVFFI